MKRTSLMIVGCLLIVLVGCSEGGPVAVDAHDGPAMRVSGLGGTYAYIPNSNSDVQNPDIHATVTEIIEKDLQDRGFAKAESASASFWVEYRLLKKNVTDASVNPHGEVYPEGTLIVRLLDPATQKVIWAASAKARILPNAPIEERRKRLEDGVHKMFNLMPPK